VVSDPVIVSYVVCILWLVILLSCSVVSSYVVSSLVVTY
jgi:hypothetical protein